jgi:hypothetical protein
MRDAHEHLKRGPYRLLSRALDLAQSTRKQVVTANQTAYSKEDLYL